MIDIKRIQDKQVGKVFKPFYVKEYSTVKESLEKGVLQSESELIMFKVGSEYLAFSKYLMAFCHIAQGYLKDHPYMLTFCVICNSGMVMNPVLDNKMLHFYVVGAHNGMLLMADRESDTYWDHITGKGLLGKYENRHLEILQPHLVLTTKEVISEYPDCFFSLPKMNFFQKLIAKFQNKKVNSSVKGYLPPGFRQSMPVIDSRLPEMEMGLGVWIEGKAKFYPVSLLKENGNVLFDTINNQNMLLYISPITHTPMALFIGEVKSASFDNDKLVLDSGDYILSGSKFSSKNEKIDTTSPNYIFSRWYGFATTFPNCEIKTSL